MAKYKCPLCGIQSDEPGKCPNCQVDFEEVKEETGEGADE